MITQVCTIDGGGAGDPARSAVSDGGLIDPSKLPARAADLDTGLITSAAADIRTMGSTVDTQTDAIKNRWTTGLPGCYSAPEQETVFALMDSPAVASETLKTTFDSMAGHLDTYADALEKIKPKLAGFEQRAQDFRDRVVGGVMVAATEAKDADFGDYAAAVGNWFVGNDQEQKLVPWYEDGDTVDTNNAFLDEIAGLYAQVSTAASACATSINGLTSLPPDKKKVEAIPKEAFTNPESPMPWGNPREEDRNCPESVGHGAYQFGKGTVEGLGSLISYNPETGDWGDWGHAGQAWMGTGNLLLSVAITANPFVQLMNAQLKMSGNGDSAVSQWIDERNKMTATVATSIVGIDLNAKDIFHKWKEDGVATFTESFLNVGTMFIPGAGQVGAGLRVAGMGARVAKISAAVADFAVPAGSWLVKGGLHAFPVLKDIFKFADDVPVNMLDDAAKVSIKGYNPASGIDEITESVTSSAGNTPVSQSLFDRPVTDLDAPRSNPGAGAPDAPIEVPRVDQPGSNQPSADQPGSNQPSPDQPSPDQSSAGPPSAEQQPGSPADAAKTSSGRPVGDAGAEAGTGTQPQTVTDAKPETTTRPDNAAEQPQATRPESPQPDAAPTAKVDAEGAAATRSEPGEGRPVETAAEHPGAEPSAAAHADPVDGHPVETADPQQSHPDTAHGDGDGPNSHEQPGGHEGDGANTSHESSAGTDPNRPAGFPEKHRNGNEYRFDSDGKAHLENDPDHTFRDRNGRLHHDRGPFAEDPYARGNDHPTEHAHGVQTTDPQFTEAQQAAHDAVVADRTVSAEAARAASGRLDRLIQQHHLDPDMFTGSKADVIQTVSQLKRDGVIDRGTARSLTNAVTASNDAAHALRNASERMGDRAAALVSRLRGETTLIGSGGAGAGRFDHVSIGDPPPRLTVYEAKGGSARLGYRTVDGVRAQQGTGTYLKDIAQVDPRFAENLRNFIEQNPGSPITKALENNSLKVNYDLVQALPNGQVKVTRFEIDVTARDLFGAGR